MGIRAEHVVHGTLYDYYVHHCVLLLNVKCRQYSACEKGSYLYRFNTCLVNSRTRFNVPEIERILGVCNQSIHFLNNFSLSKKVILFLPVT